MKDVLLGLVALLGYGLFVALTLGVAILLTPYVGDAAPFVAWFGLMIPVSIVLVRIEKREKRRRKELLN